MKKNYFYSFFAALMLFVAMPATAQVENTDLFGKWKFSATLEFAEGVTDEQKAMFSGDCDVMISKDENGIWDAVIVGLAGSQNPQYVHSIIQSSTSGKYAAKINSPDPYGAPLFSGMLLANAEGHNPYNHFVPNGEVDENGKELGEYVVYGPIYYVLNDEKTEMTVPDFTVVTVSDYQAHQANIVAKFTNAKMTLVEAETIEVANVSGDYVFKAAAGQWMTMEGSKIPTEFAVSIVSKSDDNKSYDATIAIEGYDAVTLPATYNGSVLALNFNNSYIKSDYAVIENSIRFAEYYQPANKEGKIQFKSNENGFSLSGGLAFVSDSIGRNKADTADSTYVVNRQYYADGSLKIAEETIDFNWAGVYTVNSKSVTLIDKENKDEWASEFEMKIEMVNAADGEAPVITSFLGCDIKSLCGGLVITPAADGKSATVALNGWYSMAPLQSLGNGEYLVMTNAKGQNTQLTLTVNEDGTLSIENFAVAKYAYGAEEFNSIVVYKDVTAEPYVAPAFNWAGTYVFAGEAEKVSADDTTDYPEAFNVVVKFYEETAYTSAMYGVTEFMNTNVYNINYGPIVLNIAEDSNSATLANGNVYSLGGGNFMKIFDAEGKANPVAITLGENGAISMADFTIVAGAWGDNDNNTKVASYSNVTLKKVLGAPVLKSPDTSKDINSLQIFSFNFGEEVKVDVNYAGGLSLMKGEEKVANFDLSWTEVYENGDVIFWLPFDAVVKEPGTYTLELPADMITAADGKEFIGAKYEFTVVAPAPSYSINPNGGKVNSIEKITIKCENVSEVVVDETKMARLVCGLVAYDGVVAKAENNIEITFDKIEEEGEYTLTIAEGLFTMKGLDGSEVASEEIEVTFTVEAPAAVTPLEFVNIEVMSDGAINIVYNQPVDLAMGEDWQLLSQSIVITNENGEELTLLQAPEWTIGNGMRYVSSESEYNGYDYEATPLPAGTYTIDLSQVVLKYAGTQIFGDGYSYWEWAEERGFATGTYTFTIVEAETAIEGVEAEAENTVIYDLTGRRVNEITKAGIYIVNGKKVLVK